ncbi:hypothetical protein OFR29_12230 [Brachyspira hyodysenteriae]|nr:hypothetical protein [Brachyspira hyodysenteriae]MCZ9893041.1 hypothetical protein [Brachyspira hyodysenteriae]MCZ9990589.1 hypothetical protein [Brachyspira hyodysenteriae]MCZ9998952.1 hypothetical protein [Brachyspira hyodysenteriae]MCZ9999743.1 hypothetical protein [Brachyspira hyodysenteriae]MDA0007393.1 hypothetical protein [Brachyspira hyodysenteriae]
MAEKLDRKKLEEYRINKAKEIGLRKGSESSTAHKFHILVCGEQHVNQVKVMRL